jgi:ribosomal protein S18 acetylase RimI-like enzyme
MERSSYGGKPVVLRCARCGRFVDWEEAQLMVVCGCRPHLELPPVEIRPAEEADRPATLALFERDFGRTNVVAFGEVMELEHAPALVAHMKGEMAGALAYRWLPDKLHIIALATDPMWQRSGVGGHLVAEAELNAIQQSRKQVVVCTTNDNLPSLYFYQRRGYHISEVVPGGIASVAQRMSSDGVRGFAGIVMRDEIRLVKSIRAA